MSNNQSNSVSKFSQLMKEVYGSHEREENLSLNLTLECIARETTFSKEWLERYFKSDLNDRTEALEAVLVDLDPNYKEIKAMALLKKGDMSTDPKELAKQQDEKPKCVKRRNAALAMMRKVLVATYVFRAFPLATNTKAKIDSKKRMAFSLMLPNIKTGELEREDLSLSFESLVDMGQNKLTQLGATVTGTKKKPDTTTAPSTPAAPNASQATQTVSNGQVSLATMADDTLTGQLKAVESLIKHTNFEAKPDETFKALNSLLKVAVVKYFGNQYGKVDLKDLRDDWAKFLIDSENPKGTAPQISANPEDRKEQAA